MNNIIKFNTGLTPKEKISHAHDYLFEEHPIGIPFLSKWKVIEDDSIPTACTNGKHLKYSPSWIGKLPSNVVKAIVLHEVAHVLFGHNLRRGDRDPRLWNIAADLAINSHLEPWYDNLGVLHELKHGEDASGLFPLEGKYASLPPCKSAEWYYLKVLELVNQPNEPEEGEEGQDEGEPPEGAITDPGPADGGEGQPGEEPGEGKDTDPSKGKAEGERELQDRIKDFLGDDYDKPGFGDVEDSPESSDDPIEAEEDWKEMVSEAVIMQKAQGKGLGQGMDILEDHVNKRTNNGWAILRQWVTKLSIGGYTWKRPSRRHGWRKGIVLPNNRTKNKTSGVVILDTSGSMGRNECDEAMRQIDKICREYSNAAVTLVQCDTKVHETQVKKFTKADFPLKVPEVWYGRGGTEMYPSIEWVSKRSSQFDWCIMVSDMYWEVMWEPENVPHTGVPTVYLGVNTDPEVDIKPHNPQTHCISVQVAA
jgi:predicted metal-dependent peptidase